MPKVPDALVSMPPAVSAALKQLGENLALARVRRKESQRAWARRLGVSVPTLIRLEQGDPGVSIGVHATALWLIGQAQALPELAEPARDRGALELDVRAAQQRRAVRSAASVEARLGRGAAAPGPSSGSSPDPPVDPPVDPPADPPSSPPARRPAAGARTRRKNDHGRKA